MSGDEILLFRQPKLRKFNLLHGSVMHCHVCVNERSAVALDTGTTRSKLSRCSTSPKSEHTGKLSTQAAYICPWQWQLVEN